MEKGGDERKGKQRESQGKGKIKVKSTAEDWAAVTSKQMMFSFSYSANTQICTHTHTHTHTYRHTNMHICTHRIDFFLPRRRRAALSSAIVGVLYAFTDKTMMKPVCQNGFLLTVEKNQHQRVSKCWGYGALHGFVSILQKNNNILCPVFP